ncbi:helix-turn-helix domain-containing protein [Catenulispora pinisilvae]|uniref:helix-turn-helix domain-containing protein n=1 Tax=Catenulispora pinisilvae TaxID=2705253 RepID=UPI001891573E|nr:helix-turn-helix domain-containing protein [Catenulispora pinisilvae]
MLRQAYLESGLTKKRTAARLGISSRYLDQRLVAAGLFKRVGAFKPKTAYNRQELRERAAQLYQGGASMQVVAERLGVTISTVRKALHESAVPIRRRGYPSSSVDAPRRLLIEELYADPRVVGCLRRHGVAVPDPGVWEPPGPRRTLAPMPLSGSLLRELYRDIGLATLHISMVCGVGITAVRKGLAVAEVALRPRGDTSPWLVRTYGLASASEKRRV